jgi:hypothetical protein
LKKSINVPINENSIINTLEQLQRTPQAAGIIGVALRRKIEYKNNNKNQLVNLDKLFKMLDKLKRYKSNYYQFYDAYNIYKSSCKKSDPEGYNIIYTDEINFNTTNIFPACCTVSKTFKTKQKVV